MRVGALWDDSARLLAEALGTSSGSSPVVCIDKVATDSDEPLMPDAVDGGRWILWIESECIGLGWRTKSGV